MLITFVILIIEIILSTLQKIININKCAGKKIKKYVGNVLESEIGYTHIIYSMWTSAPNTEKPAMAYISGSI